MTLVTVLGYIAASMTTLAFLPQVIKCWRTRRTKDISLPSYLLLGSGVFLWFAYGILIHDLPVIMANGIVFVLITMIIFLKLRHG